MIAFSGCPTSCQYRRASFAAVSTESEPPEVKKILLPATGAMAAKGCTLAEIVAAEGPFMKGGTFALDGGSNWWSTVQQVFVEKGWLSAQTVQS